MRSSDCIPRFTWTMSEVPIVPLICQLAQWENTTQSNLLQLVRKKTKQQLKTALIESVFSMTQSMRRRQQQRHPAEAVSVFQDVLNSHILLSLNPEQWRHA